MINKSFDDLRERVESYIDDSTANQFSDLRPKELLHELSVYHAELLAQNEELQHALNVAEQQSSANRALFEAAPIGYFILSPKGDIEQANENATRLMLSAKASIGQSFSEVFNEPNSRLAFWLFDWGSESSSELQIKFKAFRLQLTKARYLSDRILITVTDTTELAVSRERYQSALTEMKRDRAKLLQGLAVMGHELRTPLTSMLMMLEEQQVQELEPYGNSILNSAEHIANVLDDLQVMLDPSESKQFALREESPYALAERVITSLRFVFEEHHIKTKINSDKHGSRQYLIPVQAIRQILTNLLKNAAIHSHAAEVRVRLTVEDPDSDTPHLVMQVADNGAGIPKAKMDSIFSAFERGDSNEIGTGLGLFVSRQIATTLGGKIFVKSEPNDGARFFVSIPISRAQGSEQLVSKAQHLRSMLENKSVLLADDDQFQRMLMKKYLQSMGAQVTDVADGAEALTLVTADSFDLLVSDLNMPNIDGLDLLRELRVNAIELPSIIATGGTDPDTKQRLIGLGALAVLTKPVKAADIAEVLAERSLGR